MITFVASRERATPLSQVLEILPWHAGLAVDQPGTALLGLATSRGRAMPVLCLATLLGEPRPRYGTDACILVVANDGAATGFVVERLRSLETAAWEPRLPQPGREPGNALASAIRSGDHVLVIDERGQRTLAVLDLERIAAALRDGATPVAA
jgi:purine-binding chemotaxis protein CheW